MTKLAAAVVFALVVVACGCASGRPPAPEDVAAARVCRAFRLYVEHKGSGQDVVNVGRPLVNPDRQPYEPQPKWEPLIGTILVATEDDISQKEHPLLVPADPPGVKATGNAILLRECNTIPTAAKRAGGYASWHGQWPITGRPKG